MKSTNAQPGPPNSSETSELLDPIESARTLTQQYSALSADVAAFGFRDRFFAFLQGNFQLGYYSRSTPTPIDASGMTPTGATSDRNRTLETS
jgi:hypothetical protein